MIEKHGLHTILKPFIHDLNILSTTGIEVNVDGIIKVHKGAVLAFLADNLASNDLGGFKSPFHLLFVLVVLVWLQKPHYHPIFIQKPMKREMMSGMIST